MKNYTDVDAYIRSADKEKQLLLKAVRKVVRTAVPKAEETIAYGMPAYIWKDKPLFYFAAMKGHLGLYPTPGPIKACKALLEKFSTSKGCVRVPYSQKIPKTLIVRLIKERIKEISAKK